MDKEAEVTAEGGKESAEDRGTQPYTEQNTAKNTDQNSEAGGLPFEDDEDEVPDPVAPFTRCDDVITELFGRLYSEFQTWLDSSGKVHHLAPTNVDFNVLYL